MVEKLQHVLERLDSLCKQYVFAPSSSTVFALSSFLVSMVHECRLARRQAMDAAKMSAVDGRHVPVEELDSR